MLDEYRTVAESITHHPPTIPLVSSVSGAVADLTPEYWVRQVREPVRFADAVTTLARQGVTTFVELGPDGVLTAMGRTAVEESTVEFTPVLRKGRDEVESLAAALGVLAVRTDAVDWAAFYAGAGRVPLPTYAFQRKNFWLLPGARDVAAAGLGAAEHPLLGAVVDVAGGDGLLMTGRLSVQTHPWLADHVVLGTVLVPGAALVEMARHAATRAGCAVIEELVLRAPLVLPATGAVVVQVAVGVESETGQRTLTVHSRPEQGTAWVQHAAGTLAEVAEQAPVALTVWPPPGAATVSVADTYDVLADLGLEYGPAFQGLRKVWRRGEDVYAEVVLDEAQSGQAGRFGLHPALLDSALHALVAAAPGERKLALPFAWNGITVATTGATALRVRISPAGDDTYALQLADDTGTPVATIDTLAVRPTTPEQLAAATPSAIDQHLYELTWVPVEVPDSAAPAAKETGTIVQYVTGGGQIADAVRDTAYQALAAVQSWLAEDQLADARLVLVTAGAAAVAAGEDITDPAAASVWGLVRTAQSEHPDQFVLVDTDNRPASRDVLDAALATGESQLAIRDGAVFLPRLARAVPAGGGRALDPAGTVLITGGTSGLGALFARHLVTTHGVRHLLLLSRRGTDAAGVAELTAELTGLGATVAVAACDVTDRAALGAVIAAIPAAHPLTGVVHSAGVLDDGTVDMLTPERLDRVLAPKVDAAVHLHELTEGHDLALFALFSSVAGVLGGPGQANYAAANAVLDAIAQQRQARGLPALSLAWGRWARASGMAGELSEIDLARLNRGGVRALSTEEGLALFDLATGLGSGLAVPVKLSPAGLSRSGADLPLVRAQAKRAGTAVSLVNRLTALRPADRAAAVLELVLAQVATVLAHSSPTAIAARQAFTDMGFDSLTAVELRNRINAATGLTLPATLVFDHPNPESLAGHVLAALLPDPNAPAPAIDEDALRRTLASVPVDRFRAAGILDALLTLAASAEETPQEPAEDLDSMDVDDLVRRALTGRASKAS
jgi:malonyl CoA-acyl carrier protein transacylase